MAQPDLHLYGSQAIYYSLHFLFEEFVPIRQQIIEEATL
jgi:hypothetical protein